MTPCADRTQRSRERISAYFCTQGDLSAIWDFTQERWDTRQAEAVITKIQEAIELLVEDPRRGLRVDRLRSNYRRDSHSPSANGSNLASVESGFRFDP